MRKSNALTKLKSQKGETIAELLVALLIAALALTMLAAMISSSSKVILRSMDSMVKYVAAENEIVSRREDGEQGTGTATFKIKKDGAETTRKLSNEDSSDSISVDYYQTDAFGKIPVISYVKSTPKTDPTAEG